MGEGSAQTHWTVSDVSAHQQYDERDRELERLRRLVMDLELEARGRRHERNRNPQQRRNQGEGSSRSSTRRSRDRSRSQESHRQPREPRHRRNRSRLHGYDHQGSESPEERLHHNAAMDAIRLLGSLLKSMHILGKLEGFSQSLGNTAALALVPHPNTGG